MSELELRRKQKNRIAVRIIVGLLAGTIGYAYSNWQLVFLISIGFCIIEAIWLFLKAKSNHEARNFGNDNSGESAGYALSLTLIQFTLSLFIILLIGSLLKFILQLF